MTARTGSSSARGGATSYPRSSWTRSSTPLSREAVFVGSVWSDQYNGVELGNRDVIEETRLALADHGIQFKCRSNLSDKEMVAAVREARGSRLRVRGASGRSSTICCPVAL